MGKYLDEYIVYYAPVELREDYVRLRDLTEEIKELEMRLDFAKKTYSGFKDIAYSLDLAKEEYSKLHLKIVEQKKQMKVKCNWELRKGI